MQETTRRRAISVKFELLLRTGLSEPRTSHGIFQSLQPFGTFKMRAMSCPFLVLLTAVWTVAFFHSLLAFDMCSLGLRFSFFLSLAILITTLTVTPFIA